jgi:hypothetical protein
MKHVNDPVPSVLDKRPDAPIRLAALIERCMAKDPVDRPASMDEVVSELKAVVAELDGRETGEGTMIMRKPRAEAARAPRRPRERRLPILPLLALVLLAVAIGGLVYALRDDGENGGAQAGGEPATLTGVASFDPQGDNEEHSERVADATDDDPATYWTTESYEAFSKPGVGLVLEVKGGEPSQLAVSTDTPGFTAEIRAGNALQGPFDTVVGPAKAVGASTVWDLEGDAARYLVIWITELDRVAHVNEAKAS